MQIIAPHWEFLDKACACKTISPHRLGFEWVDKVAEGVGMSLEMAVLTLHLSLAVFDSIMKS